MPIRALGWGNAPIARGAAPATHLRADDACTADATTPKVLEFWSPGWRHCLCRRCSDAGWADDVPTMLALPLTCPCGPRGRVRAPSCTFGCGCELDGATRLDKPPRTRPRPLHRCGAREPGGELAFGAVLAPFGGAPFCSRYTAVSLMSRPPMRDCLTCVSIASGYRIDRVSIHLVIPIITF